VSHDAVAVLYLSSSELACGSLGLMSVSYDAIALGCGLLVCIHNALMLENSIPGSCCP